MFSLRIEGISRFIGGLLLIIMGILGSLFVVSSVGGAVPTGSWATNPSFLRDSPHTYITFSSGSNGQSPLTMIPYLPPATHQPAVLSTTIWHTAPIRAWSRISAVGLVFFVSLYLLLRRKHFGLSEEIFP
jgi:hypothetical protein